jgi:hypothetical protein
VSECVCVRLCVCVCVCVCVFVQHAEFARARELEKVREGDASQLPQRIHHAISRELYKCGTPDWGA